MFKQWLTFFSIEYAVLASVMIFIIATPNVDFFGFDQQRIFQLEIIIFNLGVALVNTGFRKRLLEQFFYFCLSVRYLLLLLLILAISSAICAALPDYALLENSLYGGLFFLSVACAQLVSQKKQLISAIFFSSLIVSSFFYQITFFTGYAASFIGNMPLQWPEPFGGFANIRFFNQYHLWLFFLISTPLFLYPSLDARLRNAIKINTAGWAILLFVSGSRGAIIAVFLALFVVFVIFKRHASVFIKSNLIFLTLGFLGSIILFKLLPQLLQSDVVLGWRSVSEATKTDAPRLYLWKTAIAYMMTHPWLGIGAMHYAYYPNLVAAHPHNSVLQWGAEMGLPSLTIVITLIFFGLVAWIKRFKALVNLPARDFSDQPLWIALFCSMVAGLIYSMVDGVIVMPVSQVLMATIAGWMFGIYFQTESQSKPAIVVTPLKSGLAFGLAAAILMTLTITVMSDLFSRVIILEGTPLAIPNGVRPRFWVQGVIKNP